MHAVVLLCPYSDSQSSELLSSDTSNPQHKTAHPHHHCLSTPSLPMTARKMIHSIPGPYSKSIIPPRITASAANACGSLLTPKSKAPRRSTVASLGIVREALPILASGNALGMGLAPLGLPSKKCGDHGKGVNEAMGQNAHPEVASRQDKGSGKNEARNTGVRYSGRTLVIMAISKEHC